MLKIISILLIKTWSPASGLARQTLPVYFGQYSDIAGDINNILAFYCNIPWTWTHTSSKQSGRDLISMSLCHEPKNIYLIPAKKKISLASVYYIFFGIYSFLCLLSKLISGGGWWPSGF